MEDCYFFYQGSCTKGDTCAFRHEPLALTSTIPCTFFQQGFCTKQPCPYRHTKAPTVAPVAQKFTNPVDKSLVQCHWETQPGGCTKPQCQFKHNQKVVRNLIQAALQQTGASSKVLINPNHTPKPIKERLGVKDLRQTLKSRSKTPSEADSEEEELRRSALKTLDLRKRLESKSKVNTSSTERDHNEEYEPLQIQGPIRFPTAADLEEYVPEDPKDPDEEPVEEERVISRVKKSKKKKEKKAKKVKKRKRKREEREEAEDDEHRASDQGAESSPEKSDNLSLSMQERLGPMKRDYSPSPSPSPPPPKKILKETKDVMQEIDDLLNDGELAS